MKQFWKKHRTVIITMLLMIVIGTCMHFVCELAGSENIRKILGVVFPVNETSWEHMKMLWYPFLTAGIILSVIRKNKGCFGGFVIGGTIAMLTMLGLFSFYQSFTRTSVLALDIPLFCLVIILCVLLGLLLSEQEWCKKALPFWIIWAGIVTAVIIYLTYQPGPGYVFLDNSQLS